MSYIIHELIDEYSGHYLHEVQTWVEVVDHIREKTSAPKKMVDKFLAGKTDSIKWDHGGNSVGEIFVTSGKLNGPLG